MAGFLTHRRLVHDTGLPALRRHAALRTCLTRFAPYGFRATYHHLTLSARIPRVLTTDPESLVRAVEELHEARVLWLAQAEEYAVRRRAEKRTGRRAASTAWWNTPWWSNPNDVWRQDPCLHPSLPLPEYVRRQGVLGSGVSLPGCPACGDERPSVPVRTGHGFAGLCRGCARVLEPCPCGGRHVFAPSTGDNWKRTWARTHMTGSGTSSLHWPDRTEDRISLLSGRDAVSPW